MNLHSLRPLLAILALLLMQQLGMLHRYAHAPISVAVAAQLQADSGDQLGGPGVSLAGNFGSLPAHEARQCGLLDHLCAGDAVVPAVLVMPAAVATSVAFVFFARTLLRAPFLAFQARAPPVLLINR